MVSHIRNCWAGVWGKPACGIMSMERFCMPGACRLGQATRTLRQRITARVHTMSSTHKVRVAVVGLGFGAEFVPIYLHHPDVEYRGHLRSQPAGPLRDRRQVQVERRHASLDEILAVRRVRRRAPGDADPAPRRADRGRAAVGQALRLHRADGHQPRRPHARSSRAARARARTT